MKKIIIPLLTVLFFFNSCETENLGELPEEINSSNICALTITETDLTDSEDYAENLIYAQKDFASHFNLNTKEAYKAHYVDVDPDYAPLFDAMDNYAQIYGTAGFSGLVNHVKNEGKISVALADYLTSYQDGLAIYTMAEEPDLEEFTAYIEAEELGLASNSTLCANEKYFVKIFGS